MHSFRLKMPLVIMLWVVAIEAAEVSAQITSQQALDSAAATVSNAKDALTEKKNATSAHEAEIIEEVFQIGRILLYSAQMTAEERMSCAAEVKQFTMIEKLLWADAKAGNQKYQEAWGLFYNGFLALIGGDPGTAKTKFDQARTVAAESEQKWQDAFDRTIDLKNSRLSLKSIIDAAIM